MKAKVIIENGHTEIVLTPDNDFEKDIIEKVHDERRKKFTMDIKADMDYSMSMWTNPRFTINVKEIKSK